MSNPNPTTSTTVGTPSNVPAPQAVSTPKPKEINLGALSSYKIKPLKDKNWSGWKARMMGLLKLHGVSDHVDGTTVKQDLNNAEELVSWNKLDQVAQTLIMNSITDEQMVHVTEAAMAEEMWNNLKSIHQVQGQQSVVVAKRNLFAMRAAEGVNIIEHVNEMKCQQNDLHLMGEIIMDKEYKSLLVMSLPDSWDAFTSSYLGTHTDTQGTKGITSQEITSLIIDEYN